MYSDRGRPPLHEPRRGSGRGSPSGGRTFGRGNIRGRGRGRGHDDRFQGNDRRHVHRSANFEKRREPDKGKGKGKGRGRGGLLLYRPPAMRPKGTGKSGPSGPPVNALPEEQIHKHWETREAHDGPIRAIAMTEQGIFTASEDKNLKRWKPEKGADGRFTLTCDLTVPLGDGCHSLLCKGGWIFTGLFDGSIRAFEAGPPPSDMTLKGHTRRVQALTIHQSVLISGAADSEVRLWQMNPDTKTFSCTHAVTESVPGPVNCLHVLGQNLFIGTASGIAMCNLEKLQVTKVVPPLRRCLSFLEFQDHLIASYGDGSLIVFDGEGNQKSEKPPTPGGPILDMAGLEVGPRLLCGHAKGQVSVVTLPEFEFKAQFQAFNGGNAVESVTCAMSDGLFVLGSKYGALQLWQKLPG